MSGRFCFLLSALVAVAVASACTRVGVRPDRPDPGPGAPAALGEPVVEPGAASPAVQARSAELFRLAQDALAGGRASQALALADSVVETFPSSPVSGRALRLVAEAAVAAEEWEVADEAAERYAALLEPVDARRWEMRLLQARAMAGLPDEPARVERLLRIPPEAPAPILEAAREQAREAVRSLSTAEARALAERARVGGPAGAVLDAWLSRLLLAQGEAAEAERYARAALEAGAAGPDSAVAAAVLDPAQGDLPELPGRRSARVGTVLPLSGSPALQELARLVAEGVEVAAVAQSPRGLDVEVLSRDDGGDPGEGARWVAELEDQGVLGAVGFLRDRTLDAASSARGGSFPLVTPTAHAGAPAPPGVFTLAGADPRAAAAVSEYAAGRGYQRAAILHSRAPESEEEARAIERTLQNGGVPVVGTFAYDAGATFFQEPIRGAREVLRMQEIRALGLTEDDTLRVEELDRVALFVPIPAEDVEYVAPQLTFYGLDTLGIDIYGTSGWTDPRTLEVVDDRHTTGVVATTPAAAGPGSQGYARFEEAYESHFQRSLVSPVPALGYDAALLLLEAIRQGASTPAQVEAALGRVRDLEGATGVFSVVDGRVLRRQEVVRIVNGGTIPAN